MKLVTKYQKQIIFLLLLIISVNFFSSIYIHKVSIFKKFNPKVYEQKYNNSQWMIHDSKNTISDEDLYIYFGHQLILGHDPSLGNAEVPPFGKYLIGYVTAITGYLGIFGILSSATVLILYFIFNKIVFKNSLIALIPVMFFSFDGLFKEQIGLSLLDTLYLSFLLLSFIFFIQKRYFANGIAAGLFMATKSPFTIIVLLATYLVIVVFQKELVKQKFNLILLIISASLTYILVYIQIFLLGHNFIYFLKVQKYMIYFYQTGAKGAFGAVFPLYLIGYWITWFGKNIFIPEWNILWPLTFLLAFLFTIKRVRKYLSDPVINLHIVWVIFYLGFLSFTPVWPRYLLLIIPFVYNLAILFILSKKIRD